MKMEALRNTDFDSDALLRQSTAYLRLMHGQHADPV